MKIQTCFNLKLRQANRVLTNYYNEYLTDLGIKITQFSLLRSLWYMKTSSQKELEKVLVVDQATLTRNLQPLIRQGYIQTERSNKDRRVTIVSLTESGKELYHKAHEQWQKAQQSVSTKLGTDALQQLLDASDTLLELKS